VRALLAEGAIGKLVHVQGTFSFDNRADPDNIRNKAETGGGALRDIGVYVIGSARYATGADPGDIRARIRWENGIDVFTEIGADFPDFTYHAVVSTRMAPAQEMLFLGEAGNIRVTAPFNAEDFGDVTVTVREAGGRTVIERFNAAHQYEAQVAAFNDSATTRAPYAWTLEQARGTQAVIDTVFDRAETLA
jgi:predicted dehydrogenase